MTCRGREDADEDGATLATIPPPREIIATADQRNLMAPPERSVAMEAHRYGDPNGTRRSRAPRSGSLDSNEVGCAERLGQGIMTSTVERSALGMVSMYAYFATLWPERCVYSNVGGIVSLFLGSPIPGFNSVTVIDASADPAAVEEVVNEMAARGYPFMFQQRPETGSHFEQVITRHQLTRDDPVPLMAHFRADELKVQPTPGLQCRILAPDDVQQHLRVVCNIFDLDFAEAAAFFTPQVMSDDGVYAMVGEVNGVIVCTGVCVLVDEWAGLFSIGTVAEHRGHGYGAAITAACAHLGYSRGASAAVLQSSPMGLPVYERMGFTVQESWSRSHRVTTPSAQ
jgi:GNAT superfamily N-acetyltransferase